MATEVIEMPWQKDLHELDGETLRKEARRRLRARATGAERECSDLADAVAMVRDGDFWNRLSGTWPEFCAEYFEQPAEFVDSVTAGVRLLREAGHQGPISADQARQAEVAHARRQTDPESGDFVDPKGGRPAKETVTNNDGYSSPESARKNKPGTLRRLARSRPDLLNRIEAGELTVNAAAIEAGIRRPMRSVPVDTPEAAIRALARVFAPAELVAAAVALSEGRAG